MQQKIKFLVYDIEIEMNFSLENYIIYKEKTYGNSFSK